MMILVMAQIASAYTTTSSETLKVWFDNITFIPDGKTVSYLNVYENDKLDYTAFNMTFILPRGLKVHQVKKGREMVDDITLSERAATTHTIACLLQEDGETLKVISTSTLNDDFYNDDENGQPLDLLYSIGLVAEPTMQPGTYTAEMTGIKFVLNNGDASVPADDHVYAEIKVENSGPGTGIDEISIEEISGPCYDLQGRVVSNPASGMIVIYRGGKYLIK